MCERGNMMRALIVSAIVLSLAVTALAAPMTKINIVVKSQTGKPVDRAGFVGRFSKAHAVDKRGKAVRTTYDLRTKKEGEASTPSIPQGKTRTQIIAKGYKPFGQDFDIPKEEKTVNVPINPPQQQ